MRKLIPWIIVALFSVFCVIVLLVAGCATIKSQPVSSQEFAWEGELDPNEFDKWKVLKVVPTGTPFSLYQIRENPDKDSSVKKIALELRIPSGTMVAYQYFKGSRPYTFRFDSELGKYIEVKLDQKGIMRCMSCHQDKVTQGNSI